METLVFASNNAHKLEEIRAILGEKFKIKSLKDISCDADIPETGNTFQENALQKAQYVKAHYGLDCFADDSGLEVEALNWEPGIYSARYAQMNGLEVTSENKQNLYISSLTVEKGTNPYWQLHHHGPAFENKLVAYRIYFDHRQTVDIYGKYHQGLELRDTQFYPDSLQKASGYGDDVLWVGSALNAWAVTSASS